MRIAIALFLSFAAFLFPVISGAAEPSIETMAGQMILVGFRGLEAGPKSPVARAIAEAGVGGVILFDKDVARDMGERNIRDRRQVKKLISQLQSYAKTPLFVAVDQEGGKVQRLRKQYGFLETPSAQSIGETDKTKNALSAGRTIGSTLSRVGFNLDFAPVVDVNVNPKSPAIGNLERSFSADPEVVTRMAAAYIRGLHAERVLSCIKHFPGHGSAGTDSHLGVTDVSRTWKQEELLPYRALIRKNMPDMIMTAHVFNAEIDPEYPATLSKRTITGLLRKKLGFKGVVVTDDMNMGAITSKYGFKQSIALAIHAGADILVYGNNLVYDADIAIKARDAIVELVTTGKISKYRIKESYLRIQDLKEKSRISR